jgi:hypothetical protein
MGEESSTGQPGWKSDLACLMGGGGCSKPGSSLRDELSYVEVGVEEFAFGEDAVFLAVNECPAVIFPRSATVINKNFRLWLVPPFITRLPIRRIPLRPAMPWNPIPQTLLQKPRQIVRNRKIQHPRH